MNTIRRYAADDAHVIYGTAYDESLGDQLRVTVIATGLSSVRRTESRDPRTAAPLTRGAAAAAACAAHRHRQPALLNQVARSAGGQARPGGASCRRTTTRG